MTVIVKRKHIQAFTLVETVTALVVSGAVFIGVFSIFAILNDKFEAELVRGELVAYCNYALDDVAQSIRLADGFNFISDGSYATIVDGDTKDTYSFSEEEGILKNGNPIHEELQYTPNNMDAGISKHKIFYIPQKKNGFIKYKLYNFIIYKADDQHTDSLIPSSYLDVLFQSNEALLNNSTFVIELHTELIMGLDEDDPKIKKLEFKRIAFSAGAYIYPMLNE